MADRTRDTYTIENPDQHTQECLDYAEQTGKPFCILECGDRRSHRDGDRESPT